MATEVVWICQRIHSGVSSRRSDALVGLVGVLMLGLRCVAMEVIWICQRILALSSSRGWGAVVLRRRRRSSPRVCRTGVITPTKFGALGWDVVGVGDCLTTVRVFPVPSVVWYLTMKEARWGTADRPQGARANWSEKSVARANAGHCAFM